ncbi:MAG: cytochrome P450 [Chloroflexi bacterium]|nr:cytochrome P450 [Chloroflexota bacterium]
MTITESTSARPHNRNLPPRVPGLPLLGNALDFLNRPIEFFLESYHKYGPIFRITAANQKFIVMGGLEANRFFSQDKDELFSSEPLFGEFAVQMGSRNVMIAQDGEPHRHMRKIMQHGYSKSGLAPHLDAMAELTYQTVSTWEPGQTLYARDAFQRLVTEQLGLALTRHSSREHFEAIRIYLSTLLNVLAIKRQPRILLSMPHYVNARKKVLEFVKLVLEEHRQTPNPQAPDLVDDMLTALDWNGDPFKEEDILAAAIGPFFAGMDTVANTMGFMIYAILKHPEVYEAIQAEVDEHFANGIPPYTELPKLQHLYAATIETLRRYPVAPFTPCGTTRDFEFAGYHVPAGSDIIIANGLTHFLPEFFPDPWTFDIQRYIAPRKEHKQGLGIFAPYSLGAHTCLGAGVAEVQLMVTVGALVRAAKLELIRPDYELKSVLMPIPGPDPKFQIRVAKRRL